MRPAYKCTPDWKTQQARVFLHLQPRCSVSRMALKHNCHTLRMRPPTQEHTRHQLLHTFSCVRSPSTATQIILCQVIVGVPAPASSYWPLCLVRMRSLTTITRVPARAGLGTLPCVCPAPCFRAHQHPMLVPCSVAGRLQSTSCRNCSMLCCKWFHALLQMVPCSVAGRLQSTSCRNCVASATRVSASSALQTGPGSYWRLEAGACPSSARLLRSGSALPSLTMHAAGGPTSR